MDLDELHGNSVDRRSFLKAAATGGAAFVGAQAVGAEPPQQPDTAGSPQAEAPAAIEIVNDERPGSDFMMDVLKPLGFEYVTINPHSDSGGLQESIINYTGNKNPELITCLHEEIAVAIAHGYFKIEGKPLAALMYSSVGLQHASMAVYSAFCDGCRYTCCSETGCGIPIHAVRGIRWPWRAISPSGTTSRCRSNSSRRPRCAPIPSP
jgi:acetolactate synthase I/II/III large subunit